jgi:hypothetical protein
MTESTPPPPLPDSSPDRNMFADTPNDAFDAMFLHPLIVSPDDFNDDWGATDTEQALAFRIAAITAEFTTKIGVELRQDLAIVNKISSLGRNRDDGGRETFFGRPANSRHRRVPVSVRYFGGNELFGTNPFFLLMMSLNRVE